MEEMTAESGAQRRFITLVLSLFAGMAYVLAAVGLYGVIAYTVAQRTSEIGIRMALGAQGGHIARMVVGRGMLLAGAGVVVGLAAAIPLTGALRGLLYGVTSTDPMTFIAIAVLLPAVALVACMLPARRALRIDPVSAMRSE
jgi:ABC-type antimicrobial peptide transport system permease subunit